MKKTNSGKTVLDGIEITHPDKILYPDVGLTKAEFAEYYKKVAKWMLPYVAGRPLSLVRCPGGQNSQCFFQKHPGTSLPKGLDRISIQEKKNKGLYVVVHREEDLIQLAQMNVLEIHCWGASARDVDHPDCVVLDLDPGPNVRAAQIVEAAKLLRSMLKDIKLNSFVRNSGGKGLHVVVPIKPVSSWKEVKSFAETIARALESEDPKAFTAVMSKSKRSGRIFVDYLRNGKGATSIANYSTRARPGAPIATPLAWEELIYTMKFNAFTINNIFKRLKPGFKDPWKGFLNCKQKLP